MKIFTLKPILGRKTDVLPDDESMLKMVSGNVALSHAAGGENFDLKRKKNACTKSFGSLARSSAANASKTLCMGMYELYDGTNRTHLYMDNGVIYYLNSLWAFVALPDTYLNFDAQVGSFTAGNTITGGTSGATADIVFVYDAGTTGTLFLESVSGTFANNEVIYESAVSSEYITDSDNQNFADGTINEWVVYFDGTSGVCEYEGTDPGAEKVMEIRATDTDNTVIHGSLPTANLTAFVEGDFIQVYSKCYIEAGTLQQITTP